MSLSSPLKVAVVGCGNISSIYFKNLQRFPWLQVVAVSDLKSELVETALQSVKNAKASSVEDLLKNPEINLIVNLTPPQHHFSLSLKALEAGKSVYSEKPAALLLTEAQKLVQTAQKNKVRFGCAPDTFMGAGIQTCRKLIEDGWIGEPLGINGAMLCRGPESWHPNPEFFYQKGGGPLYDMGPYYLTCFVNLLGPVDEVISMTRKTFEKRLITSQPKSGNYMDVEVPTHLISTLQFKSGAIGSLTTSFDVTGTKIPPIEVYGTEGTLQVPDPNTFGGEILYKSIKQSEWKGIPFSHPYSENWRGLGIADMALAIAQNRPHRASGELAAHVLEVIEATHIASEKRAVVKIQTPCIKPAILPLDLVEGISHKWN